MSEDVARAVGAKSPMEIDIAGKMCKVRPLGLRELTEVQRECVEWYKRQYIKTFVDTMDMFPGGIEEAQQAREKAAKWDIDDLPNKVVYDSTTIELTDKLKRWVVSKYNLGKRRRDVRRLDNDKAKRLAAAALDKGMLSPEKYKELVGKDSRPIAIAYDTWWITGCLEGMIHFIWKAFQANGVSKNEVLEVLTAKPDLMVELSREIERLSAPAMGNG